MRVVREPMKQSTSVGPGDFFQCSRACLCTKQEMASCIFNSAFAGQTEAVAGALSTFLPVAASWRKCGLHSARNVPARPLRPRNCNNRISHSFLCWFWGSGQPVALRNVWDVATGAAMATTLFRLWEKRGGFSIPLTQTPRRI